MNYFKRIGFLLIIFLLLLTIISCNKNPDDKEDVELEFYDFGDIHYYEIFLGDEYNKLSVSREYYLQFYSSISLTNLEVKNQDVEYIPPYIIEPVGKHAEKIKITTLHHFHNSSLPNPSGTRVYSKYYYTQFRVQFGLSEKYSYTDEIIEINSVKMNVFGKIYEAPVNIKVQFVPEELTSKVYDKFNYLSTAMADVKAINDEIGGARLKPVYLGSKEKAAFKRIYIKPIDEIDVTFSFKSLEVFNTFGGVLVAEYYDLDMEDLTDSNGDYIFCHGDYHIYVQFNVKITGNYYKYGYLSVPIYGEIYIEDIDEIIDVPIGFFCITRWPW